jgi:hypothetical protein
MTDLEEVKDADEAAPVATPKACCPCAVCGKNRCPEGVGTEYLRNGATGEFDKVCPDCHLRTWQSPIKFHFDHGLPAWVEQRMRTTEVLGRLNSWFRDGPKCQVYFVNRRETDTVKWQYQWAEWERERVPRKPFSYRGWCGGSQIIIIVDSHGIETPDSIEWITYHELGHHEQQTHAHMSDSAWNVENRNEGRTGYEWEDDAGHEADSEERHVNRVATAYMKGKEYARAWWRPRVNAFLAGKAPKDFPDPNAA